MPDALCPQTPRLLSWRGKACGFYWKKLCISGLCFFASTVATGLFAQEISRAGAFKEAHEWEEPLRIAPLLSGNFGELRGNHFHTGVDLKTEGREGLVVVAATKGRIARVKMSPWGYGNALYLEGPDGITTVYAHLQRFEPRIQAWAVSRTYSGRHLGLDATPSASANLRFEAGDTLGWSGNSGGSGGPHLHFEVRNTADQHPLNPLDGWVTKLDTRAPLLPTLWAETSDRMRSWDLDKVDTVEVPGRVRFAVEGYDLLNGAGNICGLRTLEAKVTSSTQGQMLHHKVDWAELDFAVNKDMNAHAFSPVWMSMRDQVHRLHRFTSNRLKIYDSPAGDGWLELKEGEVATLRICARDAAGNETVKRLILKGEEPASLDEAWKAKDQPMPLETTTVEPAEAGTCQLGGAKVSWEARAFFETTVLGWTLNDGQTGGTLYPTTVPLRKAIEVSWALPMSTDTWAAGWSWLPGQPWPEDKWVATQRDEQGDLVRTAEAAVKGGHLTMSLSHGGLWTLERDTVPPQLLPYHSGTPLVPSGDAVWFVDDALSGLEDLQLTLDGDWARLGWDPKRSMVTYDPSDDVHAHGRPVSVVLTATDASGNVATWQGILTWP